MTFRTNILSIYGDHGKVWLDSLPQGMKEIAQKYDLSDLKKVFRMIIEFFL